MNMKCELYLHRICTLLRCPLWAKKFPAKSWHGHAVTNRACGASGSEQIIDHHFFFI